MAEQLEKEETAAEFSKRMGQMFAGSMAMLSLSLGFNVGLVDKLLSYDEPKSIKEIADDADLKERYLEEWMGTMVTSGVVDLHKTPEGYKFMIPVHRRDNLSHEGSGMAGISVALPILAQVHGKLEECFRKSGPAGISYDSYPGFHQWEYFNLPTRMNAIIDSIDSVPGVTQALESGINMCDLGCSSGNTTLKIAQKFPKSQVHGVDIGEEAIANAKKAANEKGVTNCHFHVADIQNMPADWTEKWDYIIMYDVLHDVPNVTKALSEIYRTLKKGSYLSVIDINLHTDLADNADNRMAVLEYGFSLFNCLPTSLSVEGSEGMGAAWGKEKALRMIAEAGFTDVKIAKELGGEVHMIGRK